MPSLDPHKEMCSYFLYSTISEQPYLSSPWKANMTGKRAWYGLTIPMELAIPLPLPSLRGLHPTSVQANLLRWRSFPVHPIFPRNALRTSIFFLNALLLLVSVTFLPLGTIPSTIQSPPIRDWLLLTSCTIRVILKSAFYLCSGP